VVEAIPQLLPVARSVGVVLGMENYYKDSQWNIVEFAPCGRRGHYSTSPDPNAAAGFPLR
jgi:hypothetical protein